MQTTQETVICPHCSSLKVIKNGIKANGKQNYRCRAANPSVRRTVLAMLCRNSGIRDIAVVLNIAGRIVLNIFR